MPVFDFSNTPDSNKEVVCTYTTFHSNERVATPEKPILVLDNKEALYNLNNTINTLEEEYKNLGKVDSEFESLLNNAKDIINRVEVEVEEINTAEESLKASFETLKDPIDFNL